MNPIVVKVGLKASKEKVWRAITEVNQMREWYFDNIPSFEAKVGFKTSFNVKSTTRNFYHQWEVLQIVENEKISYSWSYKNITGKSISVFEINKIDDKTVLTITCLGLDSFPKSIPEFKRESCLSGWDYFTNQLKEYLEK